MKTYNVKQIAEMLSTNPETIRRWIRDGKLKAFQSSRKGGNIVTESELRNFVKATPKYFSKLAIGVGTAGASFVAGVLLRYLAGKSSDEIRVQPEDFKIYLQKSISSLNETILQKQKLIHQTETEIKEISKQIEQYSLLCCNEVFLGDTLDKVPSNVKSN